VKNIKPLIIVALVAGVMGGAAALGVQYLIQRGQGDELPVAVINLGALIQSAAGEKEIDSKAVDAGFKKMNQLGRALADSGYLVLDDSAVVNAPDAYYVPEPAPQGMRATPMVKPDEGDQAWKAPEPVEMPDG